MDINLGIWNLNLAKIKSKLVKEPCGNGHQFVAGEIRTH